MVLLIEQVRLTQRAVDAGDSGAFSGIFLRLSLFPFGRRSAVRPSATNAGRWAASTYGEILQVNCMKKVR